MDQIQNQNRWKDKYKRHLSWELFWWRLGTILMGLALIIFGIINFNNWGVLKGLGSVIGGLILAVLGIVLAKKHWEEM